MVYLLANSPPGIALVSIREDEDSAEASGVNTLNYKLLALVLSTFFAGLAGGTFAYFYASYYYYYPFAPIWTFDPVLIVFIGGLGTLTGPIIGAVFYVVLRQVFTTVLPVKFNILIFGALFIFVVLFMPKGLVELLRSVPRLFSYFGTRVLRYANKMFIL